MAVNRRVLAGSLLASLAISVGGGYLISETAHRETPPIQSHDDRPSDLDPDLALNDRVEGTQLPDVVLRREDGGEVSSRSWVGRPLVINVWSISCEPCKREMPAFAAAHEQFGDQVTFIGVNYGRETADEAHQFAAAYGVDYMMVKDLNGELIATLGILSQPYTIFVDSFGTIVAQKGLELSASVIRSTIEDSLHITSR